MNKLLHRERVIQIGGVLLLLSPIFNLLLSIALDSPFPNPWSMKSLALFLKSVKTSSWILNAMSMVVGSMMLKGRRSSWVFVLIILGIYVVTNGLYFRQQAKSGMVWPVLSLLTNLSLFFIVYMQEFHQRLYGLPGEKSAANPRATPTHPAMQAAPGAKSTDPRPQPLAAPPPAKSTPEIRVDFIGLGPWAKVTSITASEIRMVSLSPAFPQGIESRMVEFIVGGKTVRARLARRKGEEYTFKYLHEAPRELTSRWAA